MKRTSKKQAGFTLVELMIAVALAGIVLAAVYKVFDAQHKSYIIQDRVSEMQQNLRAGMYIMEREIRMAGFDPTEDTGAGIVTANADEIRFQMDIADDDGNMQEDGDLGDQNEDIRYAINASGNLGREEGGAGGLQPLARNIDALQFYYLDRDGSETGDIDEIRSVQIAMVARADGPDRDFTNNMTYQVTLPDGTVKTVLAAQNDNFRRRMLTTVIRCRNLGAGEP